eukprot:scaffold179798_cov34-Tisochrysis_lutea.AAC.1
MNSLSYISSPGNEEGREDPKWNRSAAALVGWPWCDTFHHHRVFRAVYFVVNGLVDPQVPVPVPGSAGAGGARFSAAGKVGARKLRRPIAPFLAASLLSPPPPGSRRSGMHSTLGKRPSVG